MRTLAVDLHVHSVLSPCGDLRMSPREIVARAQAVGLEVIGISDHNTARNAPALAEAGRRAGLWVLFGVEARSREEVDVLGIFDDVEAAVEFGEWVYDRLPDVPCDPRVFGDQVIVDAAEEILGFLDRLLIGGADASLDEVCSEIRGRGGLVVPAHVDRKVDSVISQLGWLPDDLVVDAVEVSKYGDETSLAGEHPWLARVPVVRFSDAHRPEEIGFQQTRFHVEKPVIEELRLALQQRDGRWHQPVRQALKQGGQTMAQSVLTVGKFGAEALVFAALDDFIASQGHSPDSLIEVLHRAQEMFGYLRNDVLEHVSVKLAVPLARVYGVATFYHLFHLKPRGKHQIHVCTGTACYVRGADRLIQALEQQLGVKLDETTTDGLFTLSNARCIGSCGLAPAMQIGEDVYGRVEPKNVRRILRKYR